jgi:hypothetical protein
LPTENSEYGRRRTVHASRYTGRGATKFRPGSYLYINDTPQTSGVYLALFADDIYIHTTDRKEDYVLRKLQRGLTLMESWCERWNIKINEDKTQVIYFSHWRRQLEAYLTLKGRHIPFVNNVK